MNTNFIRTLLNVVKESKVYSFEVSAAYVYFKGFKIVSVSGEQGDSIFPKWAVFKNAF